jgi:hypothetical protein
MLPLYEALHVASFVLQAPLSSFAAVDEFPEAWRFWFSLTAWYATPVPEPTAMLTLPPAPFVALPDLNTMWPDDPDFAVPVLKWSGPLIPVFDASAVLMLKAPLEETAP